MRRAILLPGFGAAACALACAQVLSVGAVTTGKATGSGTLALGGNTISVSIGVVQNPTGAVGGVSFSANGGLVEEQLAPSCLWVSGNLATIRTTIVSSTVGNVGLTLIVFVQDNGGPKSAPPSAVAAVGADPYPTGCAFGPNSEDASRFLPLISGNLVVSG